jgi:hypothetical protein
MKLVKYNLLALAVLVVAITPSFGGSISGLYSTGQLNTSWNQLDLHYTILPGSPSNSPNAYTVQPYNILCCWVTNPPGTWWISPFVPINGQPDGNAPEGHYIYQTTFMLASTAGASLSGVWAVDNSATMYLNGLVVSTIANPGFNVLTPFATTNQTFQTGMNTITFDVFNNGCINGCGFNPTGLLVQFNTPEPSSLALFGSGVLGLGGLLRRRLRG